MKVSNFIIGAPKCGTTALAYYLGQHPNVFIAQPKEPWYFSTDLEVGYKEMPTTDDAYYQKYFGGYDKSRETHLVDASPSYMVSTCAVENILTYNPDARLIAMVRNPVEIAYAMHANRVATSVRHENVVDFEDAWRLQEERHQGRHLPPDVIKPILLQYRQIASVGSQLKRIMEVVPRQQMFIIVSDDLRTDTSAIYQRVLEFLRLPAFGGCDFSPANESKRWSSGGVRVMFSWLQGVKRKTGLSLNTGLMQGIRNAGMKTAPRTPLRPEFRVELVEEFKGEIEILSSLLDRDFSSWA